MLTLGIFSGGAFSNLLAATPVDAARENELVKENAVRKAMEFANFKSIQAVKQPQVNYSHTRYYQILGTTKDGRMLVAVDPASNEIVQMVKLCPYPGLFTEKVTLKKEELEPTCKDFLAKKKLPGIPEGYKMIAAREKHALKKKLYQVVYHHFAKEIPVYTDFVSFFLNGEGNMIAFSKVYHDVKVSTTPRLTQKEANSSAMAILGKGTLEEYTTKMEVLKTSLKIVYPNNYFEKWTWQWSNEQALVWVVQLGDKEKRIPEIDIWVDAHTGKIQGGEIYERPIPELIGIPNQTGDISGIWQPAMDKMMYNTGTAHTILADTPEATVVNAISNGFVFVLQSHGGTTATAESVTINHAGTFDQRTLEPDEVPANNLYYALVSCCESGHDGPGLDFKDTFISQGALSFQGYAPSINPDPYEHALVRYLAEGEALFNADIMAQADTTPWFDIIIRWQAWCLNAIYLAPLRVSISAPSSTCCSFTISATVYNGEAALATTANDVYAYPVLPPGFTITSGSFIQNTPAIPYANSWTAIWTVSAPVWTYGNYTFDVVVWSDNLGVAVHDFDDPYHKFSVHISCPCLIPIPDIILVEVFRWWDWAERLYPRNEISKKILEFREPLMKEYRSEYFFKKNPQGFLKAIQKITELEKVFHQNLKPPIANKDALERYLVAVDKMNVFLLEMSKTEITDAFAFFKSIGTLQGTINKMATAAFVPKWQTLKTSLMKEKEE
jgi:hypothetical protein